MAPGDRRGPYSVCKPLEKRWRDFVWVTSRTLTAEDVCRNVLRHARIPWSTLARDHPEGLAPDTLKRRFERACADSRIHAAWREVREFVRSWLRRQRLWPARLPTRTLTWEEVRYWLIRQLEMQVQPPPRSLYSGLRRQPPLDRFEFMHRFYRAYRNSAAFRAKFRGEMRRQGKRTLLQLRMQTQTPDAFRGEDFSSPNLVLMPLLDWLAVPKNRKWAEAAVRELAKAHAPTMRKSHPSRRTSRA